MGERAVVRDISFGHLFLEGITLRKYWLKVSVGDRGSQVNTNPLKGESMRRIRFGAAIFAVVALALLAVASAAQAQTVISGKVIGEGGEPLGGANVLIQELSLGAAATTTGSYSFGVPADRARGQTVTLVARFIGYSPVRRQITLTAAPQTQNFTLKRDPIQLDEVVVTGTADATSTKKLGFAVGVVSEAQLKEVPATSALGGLNGKVAGAHVTSSAGAPGQAPAVKLRSATSLTGTQDPLIIIDGTITRATLADINSEDIERIEVVKGAAASSIYGSDAANGVVQIFTKRGANNAEGDLSITLRNEYGRSYLPKRIPNANAHAWQVDANGDYLRAECSNPDQSQCARIAEDDGIADNPYKTVFDHQDEALRSGEFLTNYLSMGKRQGNTNWNASFQNTKQEGIIVGLDGYTRRNFRLNVDQVINDRFDLSFGGFYGKSNNDETSQGPGSPFFTLTFIEPDVDLLAENPDGSPFRARIPDRISNAANPLYALHNIDIQTDRQRYSGNVKGRYRLLNWLSAEGNFNYDSETQSFKQTTPFGFLDALGSKTDGGLFRQDLNSRSYNAGANLTSVYTFGAVRNTTKAAYVFEDETGDLFQLNASKFTVTRVAEFNAVDPANLTPTSRTTTVRAKNYFLVSTFDIKDRYIFDGLIRRDESSLFGSAEREANYYRVSGVYRLTEDFRIPGIEEFRLRASRGTAGLRPPFSAQYETFSIVGGSPSKENLGNSLLKPARSTEDEFGFNMEFLDRFSAEYTYSKKKTEDQILLVPLSAATGYKFQWQNNGTLEGSTHEMALGAVLANKKDFVWRFNVTADRTRQEITALNTAPFLVGPFYQGSDEVTQIFRIAAGQKFGVMYGARTVRTLDQLYEDPAKNAARGPGQAWSPDSVVINEEGFVVRRETFQTVDERPLKYVNANGESIVEIGDVNPDFNASFASNLNWKNFAVAGVVDWVKGGNIYNGTRQWPFFDNRDRIYDQRGKPEESKKSQQYYNFFYNSIDPIDFFVEDGSYVKLKELAVNYTLPATFLRQVRLGALEGAKVGIVGRNLLTFTDYSGYDPEVAGLSGDPYSFRFDGFSYPNFRTFTFVVELGF